MFNFFPNHRHGEQPNLLKGVPIKNKILAELKHEVSELVASGRIRPTMCIIQAGNNPRSDVYVHKKKTFGHEIGIEMHHIQLPDNVTFEELEVQVKKYAYDDGIHGVIIQMPLPKGFSMTESQRLIDLIPLEKDIDGLTTKNVEMLATEYSHAILPATARAVNLLLDGYNIPIEGRKAVVIGRSNLVGKPTALSLEHRGAKVDIIHSQTQNPAAIARVADILVVATGVPNLITTSFVNPNQTVIDVGISMVIGSESESRIVGDVDFPHVSRIVKHISPVPGGIGSLTVAGLFLNLIECYRKQTV
jgi:methylenetetrahydrofolate dehydrogenase (NADP+)/methenyltetrahydrofolate cyclohydrolase